MEDKIFYTCKIINRSFTWQEWCNYLNSPEREENAYVDGEFKWNIHDVCITPHKTRLNIEGNKSEWIVVETACAKGKWFFGLCYQIGNRGSFAPCSFDESNYFDTEKQALLAALNKARHEKFSKDIQILISKKIFEGRQLSLF